MSKPDVVSGTVKEDGEFVPYGAEVQEPDFGRYANHAESGLDVNTHHQHETYED